MSERPNYERMVMPTAEQIARLSPESQAALASARAIHGDAKVDLYLLTCANAGVADGNSAHLTGAEFRSEWDRARELGRAGQEMGVALGLEEERGAP